MKSISSPVPGKALPGLFYTLVLLVFCSFGCDHNSKRLSRVDASDGGSQKMLLTLADIGRRINVPSNGLAAKAKIAHLDSVIILSPDPRIKGNAALQKAIALLEFGDEVSAVALLEDVLKVTTQSSKARNFALYWLGTAYLRLAERNNCIAGHSPDACIMPLRGSGIHQDKTAGRRAIELLTTLLEEGSDNPNYLDAVWLLNIAYMTLGEYPQKVPQKWLVPNLDKSDYPMQPFVDIATDLKIMVNNRAGGSIVDDFNNDGLLDIVTSAWDIGEDRMHFFTNNGDGTFEDRSESSGLKAFTGGLNLQQLDYNNDGLLDIWVLRGAWQGQNGLSGDQPNSLFRNNGNGSFTDVTIETRLFSFNPTQTSSWNDFNHDGWLDVFI